MQTRGPHTCVPLPHMCTAALCIIAHVQIRTVQIRTCVNPHMCDVRRCTLCDVLIRTCAMCDAAHVRACTVRGVTRRLRGEGWTGERRDGGERRDRAQKALALALSAQALALNTRLH